MAKHLHRRPKVTPQSRPWLCVRAEADGIVEMVIAGTIGSSWYDDSGATSKEFREKFALVPRGTAVHLRINSEGGSVQDALEIYNIIRRAVKAGQEVVTFNDGYALSSASLILCAGSRVISPASSVEMIHEPWSMTIGDEQDHTRAAEMLAKHGDTIAQIYARRTGATAAQMRDMMRTETWFTGAEAVDQGLSDQMSLLANCPACGSAQTDECETENGDITCAHCDKTASAQEWEDHEPHPDEQILEYRFAPLDLSRFKNVPQSIRDLVSNLKSQISNPAIRNPQSAIRNPPSLPTHQPNPASTAVTDSMRKKIIALLKKHGLNVPENATDEWLEAEFDKIQNAPAPGASAANPAPATATAKVVDAAEFKRLQDQLDAERRTRITDLVTRRGEHRIENKNLTWWINLAMNDEVGTLAQIDSLPVARPGGDPIGTGAVSILETRLEAIKKEPLASTRFSMLKNEWDGLFQDAKVRDQRQRHNPMGANTYSATLVTNFLIDGAVTKLQNRWAALKVFSKDYSQDRYKPRATGQLKYVTAGGTTQKNASNFETSGDATVAPVSIAVDQYTTGMHVTNDELNSGLRMENLLDIKIAECADNILKIAFSPLATASFTTNAAIIRGAAAFAFSDMATAWGELKKSPVKFAVLDGEYMARIINTPAFYQAAGTASGSSDGWSRFGWDGVFLNTNWTGTHSGAGDQYIRGLFCNPQVLGAIAGLPLTPPSIPGATLQETVFTVPDVNVSVATYSWFSLASRTFWMTYDLMFGSSLLDESAGVLLTSQ